MSASSRSSGLGLLYRPLTIFKWLLLLCVPALLWVAAHVQLISDYFNAQATRNRNRAEVARLEVRYAKLLKEKADLQTGGFAAEETLRSRYKLRKPGEQVIIVEEEPLGGAGIHSETRGAGERTVEEAPRLEYGAQLPEQDPEIEAAEPVADDPAAESPQTADTESETAPGGQR